MTPTVPNGFKLVMYVPLLLINPEFSKLFLSVYISSPTDSAVFLSKTLVRGVLILAVSGPSVPSNFNDPVIIPSFKYLL